LPLEARSTFKKKKTKKPVQKGKETSGIGSQGAALTEEEKKERKGKKK